MLFSKSFKSKLTNWEENRAQSQFEQAINGYEKEKIFDTKNGRQQKESDTPLFDDPIIEISLVKKEEDKGKKQEIVDSNEAKLEDVCFSELENMNESFQEKEPLNEEELPEETLNKEGTLEVIHPDFSEITLESRCFKPVKWEDRVKSNKVFKDDSIIESTNESHDLGRYSGADKMQKEPILSARKLEDKELDESVLFKSFTTQQPANDTSQLDDSGVDNLDIISKNYLTGKAVPKKELEDKDIEFNDQPNKEEPFVELKNQNPKLENSQMDTKSIKSSLDKFERLQPFNKKEEKYTGEEDNSFENRKPTREIKDISHERETVLSIKKVDDKPFEKQQFEDESLTDEKQSKLEDLKFTLDEKKEQHTPTYKKNKLVSHSFELECSQLNNEGVPISLNKYEDNSLEKKRYDVKPNFRVKFKEKDKLIDIQLERKPKEKKGELLSLKNSQKEDLDMHETSFGNRLENKEKLNERKENNLAKKNSNLSSKLETNTLLEKPKNIPTEMFEMFKELDNKIKTSQEKNINKEKDG